MTPPSLQDLARAVDQAVAATPGVERLYASGPRSALIASAGLEEPWSSVDQLLHSYEAVVSIGTRGDAAGDVARLAAAAAASALPDGSRVRIRVARVFSV